MLKKSLTTNANLRSTQTTETTSSGYTVSNKYMLREEFLLGARGPSAISTFSLRTETSALVGFTLFIFSLPLDKVRLTK